MSKFLIYLVLFIISGLAMFFITNDELFSFVIGIFSSALMFFIDHITQIYNRIWLAFICNTKYRKSYIRLSISYLYKIKVNDMYLLVKGERIKDQFQPVGGVYKRFKTSNQIFKKYKILDDEYMPIDDISVDDIRILVPAPNVIKFLKWFDSKIDREVSPEREFREELIKTNIVSEKNFNKIDYHQIDRYETKIKYSEHFQCWEILIAEIYEIDLNDKQIKELKKLVNLNSPKFIWIDAQTIRKKGYKKEGYVRISETANWIL